MYHQLSVQTYTFCWWC